MGLKLVNSVYLYDILCRRNAGYLILIFKKMVNQIGIY